MRMVTLNVGEWVRIGEFRVSVGDVADGAAELTVQAPPGTIVRCVAADPDVLTVSDTALIPDMHLGAD